MTAVSSNANSRCLREKRDWTLALYLYDQNIRTLTTALHFQHSPVNSVTSAKGPSFSSEVLYTVSLLLTWVLKMFGSSVYATFK